MTSPGSPTRAVAPLALLAVIGATTASCAFLSGRLPCTKDSDCLSGDVCADDGYCGPGRTASNGEGEGSAGEGEGEGAGTNRVRHVSTSLSSLVNAGVTVPGLFFLHVVPFGGALCTVGDDCQSDQCEVSWSPNVEMVVGDGQQGVDNLGGLIVMLVVEIPSSGLTTTTGVFGDGGADASVAIPPNQRFTEVAYHDGGQVIVCDANAAGDNRCAGGFTTTACP